MTVTHPRQIDFDPQLDGCFDCSDSPECCSYCSCCCQVAIISWLAQKSRSAEKRVPNENLLLCANKLPLNDFRRHCHNCCTIISHQIFHTRFVGWFLALRVFAIIKYLTSVANKFPMQSRAKPGQESNPVGQSGVGLKTWKRIAGLPASVGCRTPNAERWTLAGKTSTLRVKHNSKSIIIVQLPAEPTGPVRLGLALASSELLLPTKSEAGIGIWFWIGIGDFGWRPKLELQLGHQQAALNMKIVACKLQWAGKQKSRAFQTHILIPHSPRLWVWHTAASNWLCARDAFVTRIQIFQNNPIYKEHSFGFG